MADNHGTDILDYVVLLVKWKRLFTMIAICLFVVSYFSIYFFVQNEYESTATIMPTEDKQMGGVTSLMRNLSNIPLGLGNATKSADMDLYTTILNSRPILEKIVVKFDLREDYKLKSMEKAVAALRKRITAHVNDENAYEIVVRASSAQKAADIADYVLDNLNTTVIELNVAKSKNNRIFLEQRYNEMTSNLRKAEDSLQYYQESTGMLEAKEQTKIIIATYSNLEADLITKQIELSIMENTLSRDSPQLENLRMEVKEYSKKIDKMKKEGEDGGIILALNSLPQTAKHYIRYYRDVEIYSRILEFLLPMYEQARFDEQKNVPVLQIIDRPVPPEKRSYPPRVIFSLIITFAGCLMTFLAILIQENTAWRNSDKVQYIFRNLRAWKN